MLKDVFYILLLVTVFILGSVFGGACMLAGVKEGGKIFQRLISGYFTEFYVDKEEDKGS